MSQTELEFVKDVALPQDAVSINRRAWFRDLDGIRAVFVDQTPFYCYPLDDPILHRFCAIQLVEAGLAKVKDVCRTFELHLRNFSRLRSKFRQFGIAGLFPGNRDLNPFERQRWLPELSNSIEKGKVPTTSPHNSASVTPPCDAS